MTGTGRSVRGLAAWDWYKSAGSLPNRDQRAFPPPSPWHSSARRNRADLAVSEAWHTNVLGAGPVLDEDTVPFRHIVYQLGNTRLGLHGFPDFASSDLFDERRPGLDHVAFGCAD